MLAKRLRHYLRASPRWFRIWLGVVATFSIAFGASLLANQSSDRDTVLYLFNFTIQPIACSTLFVFIAIFSLTLLTNKNGVATKILHVLNLMSFFSCGLFVFIVTTSLLDPITTIWGQIDHARVSGRVYRIAQDRSWSADFGETEFGDSGAEQIDTFTFFRCDFTGIFCQIIDYNLAVNRDHRAGLQTEDDTIYVIDEDSAEIIFTYETP
jgi:hypothetical protein